MKVTAQARVLWDELNNGDEDVAFWMEWNLEQDNQKRREREEEDNED